MPVRPIPSTASYDPFQAYNTTPLADFCGLSPGQMHQLLFHPLEPGGVVQLRAEAPNEVLDQLPFLRLTEAFLRLLHREGGIRLTPLGALPLKYLRELYALGFILEPGVERGIHKLHREIDSLALTTLHQTTRLAGLAWPGPAGAGPAAAHQKRQPATGRQPAPGALAVGAAHLYRPLPVGLA